MVIDSSALLAIVAGEYDAALYADAISAAIGRRSGIYVPASVLVEAGIVTEQRKTGQKFDALLDRLQPQIVFLDSAIASLARRAFSEFGRGRHKARLNFGDCMSYATARYLRLPLLYKGTDFSQTDIPSALRRTTN